MNPKLEQLYTGKHLNFADTQALFGELFAGTLDQIQCASMLTAMKMNGYSYEEIGGAATAMLKAAKPFKRDLCVKTGEIVGTGGDGFKTINISTMSGIVCATLGLHVAKHGNTAVSSGSGASDVLSCLGYDVRCSEELSRRNLEEQGFAFLFAQVYHQGMKYAAPVRKALGTSTLFNILGPLANPARVNYELLGCYDPSLLRVMLQALKLSGVQRALVINGNGMDEISIFGSTLYAELFEDGHIEEGILNNDNFGIKGDYNQEMLRGGTPEDNARIAREVLGGKGSDAHSAVVAANTAGMLRLAGVEPDYRKGFALAMDALRSGAALTKLETLCKISRGEL
ncbi:MAG: anthranilate phosphoribosyltransferase [Succinivibrio sp.]|nr:anthranilate phosphoribosyltransferase [Succinivibrio sp.]